MANTTKVNASRAGQAKASRPAKSAKAPLTVSREELLSDGTDRDFRALVQGLLTFFGSHVAIRDGYASLLGLTGPQYTIMLCIRNLSDGGPVSVGTVAVHLRLSGSFITVETKTLEQRGLVSKDRGTEDRRVVSLSLTPNGVALLDSIAGLRRQVNDVEFGCLSKAEFQMLVPLVERLIQSGERALALQNYLKTHGADLAEVRGLSSRQRAVA
jgi:DNA-binding MarR family transcriptional regulator